MWCKANPAWLEQQTGVAWATLKKHHGKCMPRPGASELDKLRAFTRGNGALPLPGRDVEIGSDRF